MENGSLKPDGIMLENKEKNHIKVLNQETNITKSNQNNEKQENQTKV